MNSEHDRTRSTLAAKARVAGNDQPPEDDLASDRTGQETELLAQETLEKARQERVRACQAELTELLNKHRCNLASYQELVNGMPKGPAAIVIVPRD